MPAADPGYAPKVRDSLMHRYTAISSKKFAEWGEKMKSKSIKVEGRKTMTRDTHLPFLQAHEDILRDISMYANISQTQPSGSAVLETKNTNVGSVIWSLVRGSLFSESHGDSSRVTKILKDIQASKPSASVKLHIFDPPYGLNVAPWDSSRWEYGQFVGAIKVRFCQPWLSSNI